MPGKDPLDEVDAMLTNAVSVDFSEPPEPIAKAAGWSLIVPVAFLMLVTIAAYIAATAAIDRAAEHTERRVEVLERDLAERRARNTEANAERDRQLAELRRLVCVLSDREPGRSGDMDDIRRQYGCTPGVSPSGPPPSSPPAATGSAVPTTPNAATAPGMFRPTPEPGRTPPGDQRTTTGPTIGPTSGPVVLIPPVPSPPPAPAGPDQGRLLGCVDPLGILRICV